ncbi:hypothetical protein [Mesorhizobium sp. WSM2239]|uniref:Uncharacterized protein n=2 Tax=unclassified Mesorhizobium TaxID=325217 RepID=A0AAU8DCA3_9HYPH
MRLGRCIVALICSASAASATDAEFDPSAVDLASLIECRADAREYNSFALWLTGQPEAAEALGWQELASDNPFLKEYKLPAAIGVFGRNADRVVFTASGPMAVLDAAPDELAKKLEITPEIATAEKFLGEKVVLEAKEEDLGMVFETRITLNVSTVDSHPGKTLAGCSYRIEVR